MIIKIKPTASSLWFFFKTLFVYPLLGSLPVLGAGYVLNRAVGIGLLQSTFVLLSTLFIGITALGFGFITREIRANRTHFLDDDEDEMDWLASHLKFKTQPSQAKEKTGRNQPCPCGSQKKYKACCLNAAEPAAENVPL
jgi:hypothetical protein